MTRCDPDFRTPLVKNSMASPRSATAQSGKGFTQRQLSSGTTIPPVLAAQGSRICRPPSQVKRMATLTASLCAGNLNGSTSSDNSEPGYLKTLRKSLDNSSSDVEK